MTTIGLVRLTVAAPQRRIDIALPEHATIAEYAAALLSHAGEETSDQGAAQGGWSLRRADGRTLDLAQTLAAQQVLDGDVLHLVPAGSDWPEAEYDDLVDVIAGGARRRGPSWGPSTTRAFGSTVTLTALAVSLWLILRAGPGWAPAVSYSGLMSVLLLLGGIGLARAAGDAGMGAVLGTAAVAHAAVAGALLPDGAVSLGQLGAPQLVGAGTFAALVAVATYFGIVEHGAVFVGTTALGLCTALGGWLATTSFGSAGAAAVVSAAAVVLLPAVPSLAMRFGRLPRPTLPRSAADLLSDSPQPPRGDVHAAVLRSDAFLTGLLWAAAATAAAADLMLVPGSGPSPRLLVGATATVVLLRSRLFPVVRHRLPLAAAGVAGAVALAVRGWHADPLTVTAPAMAVVAALIVTMTVWYTAHRPGAYLGRYAEVAELVVTLSLIPLSCSVLGLYGRLHGLGG